MYTLLRPKLDPTLWTTDDLDAAADHWLWLADRTPATDGLDVEHRIEIRLRGFPRSAGDGLAAVLRERLPTFAVDRPDPDTLTAVGRRLRFDTAPTPGLGVPRLAGPPFDGLAAELRLNTTAGKPAKPTVIDASLVLAGQLTPDGFRLVTVWREGGSALINKALRSCPWPEEKLWREDLERHRNGDEDEALARPLANACFSATSVDQFVNKWVWLVTLPPYGSDRRAGTLARLAVNLLLAGVGIGIVLAFWLNVQEYLPRRKADIPPLLGLAGFAFAAFTLLITVTPLVLFVRQFFIEWVGVKRFATASFTRLYADPTRVVPTDPATAAKVADEPNGRKMWGDWTEQGWRHLGDAVVEPLYKESAVHRVFVAPDGVTYANVCVMNRVVAADGTVTQHIWPALVNPFLVTRFPDGGQAVTLTDSGAVFRRKLSGPESAVRVQMGLTDEPAELLARHTELVRRYTDGSGHRPLPATTFAEYCRWQDEKTDEERGRYGSNPVTWADAFVMLMGYTRKVYRPD